MNKAADAIHKQNVNRFGIKNRHYFACSKSWMRHNLSGSIGSRLTIRFAGFVRQILNFR